jgi:hypothetical protein
MSQDRHDDDVIVISDEDIRYDAAGPADASALGDLDANDQATQAVPSQAGRFGTMTAASDAASSGDVETDTGTHPVTEPVTPAGSSYGDSADTTGYYGPTAADLAAAEAEADAGLAAAAAADDADDDAADDDAVDDADPADPVASVDATAGSNGAGSVNGNGLESAIAMPAADASVTPTPATPATPVTSEAAPDSSWPQIQSLFVDDPHAAVRQAADVAGGALAALVAAARNREQTLRDSWRSDSTGTEELRTALRDYRDLAGRLSALSRDL